VTSANALELFKDSTSSWTGRTIFRRAISLMMLAFFWESPTSTAPSSDSKPVTVFGMPDGPCYRCLYPEPPPPGLVPSCARRCAWCVAGNRRVDSGDGNHQAHSRHRRKSRRRLLLFDALGMKFRELKLRKIPTARCAARTGRSPNSLTTTNSAGARRRSSRPSVQVPEITPRELKARLDHGDDLFILDVREPHEYQICNLKGHSFRSAS